MVITVERCYFDFHSIGPFSFSVLLLIGVVIRPCRDVGMVGSVSRWFRSVAPTQHISSRSALQCMTQGNTTLLFSVIQEDLQFLFSSYHGLFPFQCSNPPQDPGSLRVVCRCLWAQLLSILKIPFLLTWSNGCLQP